MNFKSKSIPVKATQWQEGTDHREMYTGYLNAETIVNDGDWIVEFPNGELHVVENKYFVQRFEHVKEYTKAELSYAAKLAKEGDCV